VEVFYLELIGKLRLLSKQGKLLMDLSCLIKKVIGKIMFTRRGERKNSHFKIGGHVQMAKNNLETPNEVLVNRLHMVGKMSMGLDLEVLEKSVSN
jgi:hypothetical protein